MKKTKKRKTLYFTFLFATNVVAFSFLSIKCNSNNKIDPKNPEKHDLEKIDPNKPKLEENLNNSVDGYKIDNSKIFKPNFAYKITVSYVKDGDTFTDENSNNYRFLGIDTPETRTKDADGNWIETQGNQFKFGKLATNYTTNLTYTSIINKSEYDGIFPKEIYVVPQKTKNGKSEITDHYWRIVAIIYIKDIYSKFWCLNDLLVRKGYARMNYISLSSSSKYFTENIKYYKFIENAQDEAKKNKLGIWQDPSIYTEIYPW